MSNFIYSENHFRYIFFYTAQLNLMMVLWIDTSLKLVIRDANSKMCSKHSIAINYVSQMQDMRRVYNYD